MGLFVLKQFLQLKGFPLQHGLELWDFPPSAFHGEHLRTAMPTAMVAVIPAGPGAMEAQSGSSRWLEGQRKEVEIQEVDSQKPVFFLFFAENFG